MVKQVEFDSEYTTVWSFPERGNWATHSPSYRGNFAPQIPRNIIEMYSQKGETVLDPMVGGGTTAIEAKLLGRNIMAFDINPSAITLTQNSLKFNTTPRIKEKIEVKDVRDLSFLAKDSIDLIVTHPPYMNIIKYSDGQIAEDISNISSMPKFCGEMEKIARELYRVLRPDRYCAILIGDTRKGKHYVPLAFNVMLQFLRAGFILKEDIIKVQHNCQMTSRWLWKAKQERFYLIMHEHLYVFRKRQEGEDISRLKMSTAEVYGMCGLSEEEIKTMNS